MDTVQVALYASLLAFVSAMGNSAMTVWSQRKSAKEQKETQKELGAGHERGELIKDLMGRVRDLEADRTRMQTVEGNLITEREQIRREKHDLADSMHKMQLDYELKLSDAEIRHHDEMAALHVKLVQFYEQKIAEVKMEYELKIRDLSGRLSKIENASSR